MNLRQDSTPLDQDRPLLPIAIYHHPITIQIVQVATRITKIIQIHYYCLILESSVVVVDPVLLVITTTTTTDTKQLVLRLYKASDFTQFPHV